MGMQVTGSMPELSPQGQSPAPRIHTTLVLACSADGKIADHQRQAARFSSAADLAHLEARVAEADAVLSGGGTLRAYGTVLSVRQPALCQQRQQRQQPTQPLQIVWSPSGDLDLDCRFFHQPVPRALFTTAAGARSWPQHGGFDYLWVHPARVSSDPPCDSLDRSSDNSLCHGPWDWGWAYGQMAAAGVRRLALLGGGRLVAELLDWGLVDELYLTVCPLLLGGSTAPTPVDGVGFLAPLAPRLDLVSCRAVGQEVFLHYRVLREQGWLRDSHA